MLDSNTCHSKKKKKKKKKQLSSVNEKRERMRDTCQVERVVLVCLAHYHDLSLPQSWINVDLGGQHDRFNRLSGVSIYSLIWP